MKFEKYTTPLIAISAIATILFLSDVTTYARGSKSFLLGQRRSVKKNFDDKLTALDNKITALITRISEIESSISKLDSTFKTKLIFPLKNEMSDELSNNYELNELPERNSSMKKSKKFKSKKNRNYEDGFSQFSEDNGIFGYKHKDSAIRQFNDFGNPESSHSHSRRSRSKRMERHIREHENPNYFNFSSNSSDTNSLSPELRFAEQSNFNGRPNYNELLNELFRTEKGTRFDQSQRKETEYLNTRPKSSHVILKKLEISVGKPKIQNYENPAETEKLDINKILPDLTKEDPILEVKRFDDPISFARFHHNIKNNINVPDDNSRSTFFKMSEILDPASKDKTVQQQSTDLINPSEIASKENKIFSESISKNEADNLKEPQLSIHSNSEINKPYTPVNEVSSKNSSLDSIDPFDINDEEKYEKILEKKQDISTDPIGKLMEISLPSSDSKSSNLSSLTKTARCSEGECPCEDYDNPKEAFEKGKCRYRNSSLTTSDSSLEELLKGADPKNEALLKDLLKLDSKMKSSINDGIKDLSKKENIMVDKKLNKGLAGLETDTIIDLDNLRNETLSNAAEGAVSSFKRFHKDFVKKTKKFIEKNDQKLQQPTDQTTV